MELKGTALFKSQKWNRDIFSLCNAGLSEIRQKYEIFSRLGSALE